MIATDLNPRQVIRRMRANLGDLGNNAKARQVRLVTATLRAETRRLAAAQAGTWSQASAQATVLSAPRPLPPHRHHGRGARRGPQARHGHVGALLEAHARDKAAQERHQQRG